MTLVQTHKVTAFPIILIGVDYWKGLVDWLRDTLVEEKKISAVDIELLTVTDDLDDVLAVLAKADEARHASDRG